jgi:type III secretion protein SpaR/YscT/HrcT
MTDPAPLGNPIDLARHLGEIAQRWLLAYAILLPRPLALLSFHPVFSRSQFSNFLKGAIATGWVLPMLPMTASAISSAPSGTSTFLALAMKEALIGTALGFPLSLPFWVLLSAGDIIDQQRGATLGRLADPAGFGDESVTGTLFLMCGIVVVTETGHLNQIVEALFQSWRIWRPMEFLPTPDAKTPGLILHLLDQLERQAVTLCAPVLLVMLISDVATMLVVRIAPQLHAEALSLPVRNMVFMIFLPLYASFFLLYAAYGENRLTEGLRMLATVLPHSATGSGAP